MQIPQVIFFDLGDVVCRFRPERRSRLFAERTGRSETELLDLFWRSGFSSACDAGEYTAKKMCAFINDRLGSAFTEHQLAEIWWRAFDLDLEVLTTAQRLNANFRVGMLTNNAALLRRALPEFFPHIESLFDPMVFSCELKAAKPEARAFAAVESMTACAGSALMLIDDSAQNVAAASARGWQTIQFRSAPELSDRLVALGLL
ncbi:MAG: HAD-IA family hydrolase [Pseudomonadota bacterium]